MRILLLAMSVLAMLPMQGYTADPDRMEQLTGYETTVRGLLVKGKLPIIDVEFHYGQKIAIASLLDRMDANGVALTWLGPNEKLGSEESWRQHERYPPKRGHSRLRYLKCFRTQRDRRPRSAAAENARGHAAEPRPGYPIGRCFC